MITEESAQPRALSSGSMSVLRVRVSFAPIVAWSRLICSWSDSMTLTSLPNSVLSWVSGTTHPSHATAGRLGLPLFALSGVCGFQTECTLGIF